MADIRRTHQFYLSLSEHEHAALARVVERGGHRHASDAIRYLIRREDDPELGARLTQPGDECLEDHDAMGVPCPKRATKGYF
jgi:Arc/MetJ-type ribon-helix-helix transcriptional regulator